MTDEEQRRINRDRMRARRAADPEAASEKDRQWRAANSAKRSEQNKAWAKANPEKHRASQEKWAEANPERVREIARASVKQWSNANPEKRRAADTRRRKRNREGRYALDHRRRARKKAAPGHGWSAADVAAQYAAQRGKCYYCDVRLGKRFHRDHITPLAKGGAHCRSNLALACPDCNTRKGAKDPQVFAGLLL